jgi:DNA recombination protein RmuC
MVTITTTTAVICVLTAILITALVFYVVFDSKVKVLHHKTSSQMEQIILLNSQVTLLKNDCQQTANQLKATEIALASATSDYQNLLQRYQSEVTDADKKLHLFENIAHRILSKQSAELDEKQKLGMKEVLEPLKERIKTFEDKIEKTNLETVRRHESLKEQMKFLYEKSDQVSKDANNLARALKGDYKKQGNWGELILESILDKSGLVKNREYFVQVSERNDQGQLYKPDVVIHLPDAKKLIIDSKVSLVAYENMINADDDDTQKIAHRAHVLAITNHINTLSQKNYHDLYKVESPDFVLMFIPIDTAFSAALQLDPNLYTYAFDRNIVIVTSSTLLATLKTVESMWRNDKQNRYAMEIAEEAGKMYDKFVGFAEDMDKLGKQLNTAQNTYHDSMKKLTTGTGNLVNRAEYIKSLGAKTNKFLPKVADEME